MSCGLANMPSNHSGNHALPLHITIVSICMFLYVYFPHQKQQLWGKMWHPAADKIPVNKQSNEQTSLSLTLRAKQEERCLKVSTHGAGVEG